VLVVVGVQFFLDCSRRRKRAPENPHMTARHKFRPSVNVDEFDSLQGSSDPSNATRTNSSVVMRANLQPKQLLHMRVCSVRALVASHTWQPLAFWFTRIPVELVFDVSIDHIACGKWSRLLVSDYNKIPKRLLVICIEWVWTKGTDIYSYCYSFL